MTKSAKFSAQYAAVTKWEAAVEFWTVQVAKDATLADMLERAKRRLAEERVALADLLLAHNASVARSLRGGK